ncbi:MAG: hypothetical protein RLY31_146 [Bacteroidota bacterium]|jgi:hypothetical protein
MHMTCTINQLALALLFIMPSLPATGHIVYKDTGQLSSPDTLMSMYRQALDIRKAYQAEGKNILRYDILEVGTDKYLLPNGMLDVFRWEGGKWVNQYTGHSHGYNYGSTKFVFDNRIFSYGGYGFWRMHGDLIEFMPDSKEWELLPFSKDLPCGIAYLTDFGIRVIGRSPNFEIDIRKGVVRELGDRFLSTERYLNFHNLPFENYTYLPVGHPRLLVDNRTGALYQSDQQRLIYFGKYDIDTDILLQHIVGDFVFVYHEEDSLIFSTSIEAELPFFTRIDLPSPYRRIWFAGLSAGVILAGAAAMVWIRRRKPPVPASDWPTQYEDNEIINTLLGKVGQTLSQEELDMVLGITTIGSAENKRYRRSTLIKDINLQCKVSFGRELIRRLRDQKDGRQFVYEIGGG